MIVECISRTLPDGVVGSWPPSVNEITVLNFVGAVLFVLNMMCGVFLTIASNCAFHRCYSDYRALPHVDWLLAMCLEYSQYYL